MDAASALDAVTGALGAGEARPQQVEMAERVAKAIETKTGVAIQAGTGVGKTFGYLAPAIAHAAEPGKRVVVVTSSIALQDQLAGKDLPFLEAHHPDHFRWTVLKGRGNYVCHAALDETLDSLDADHQTSFGFDIGVAASGGRERGKPADPDRLDRDQLTVIAEWIDRSPTGDRAELGPLLDAEVDAATWSAVTVAPGACPGAESCAFGDQCHYEKRKLAAYRSDVLVVNAHLYGAHLALDGALLPEHDVVVIDEAHEFVDAVIGALSVELSKARIGQVAAVVRAVLADAGTELRQLDGRAQLLHEAIQRLADQQDADRSPRRLIGGIGAHENLLAATVGVMPPLVELTQALRDAKAGRGEGSDTGRIDGAILAVTGLHSDIAERLLATDGAPGEVVYLERTANTASVRLAATNVGGRLRAVAWDAGVVPILTSATLPATIPGQLGLPKMERIDVGTPFPFREHALLYVPKRFPEPSGSSVDEWRRQATEELLAIIDAAGGRTLALFTTTRAVADAAEAARRRFPKLTIHAQGELPKAELTRRFVEEETACLFATSSFWTGIDAQGATLRAVVIDKLPFPVPTDPIILAKEDLVGKENSFALVSLPAVAVQLAQGAGRLIRTSTDQGVVAVLDSRLATRSYRRQILDCLPPMKRTIDRDEVFAFLRALREADGDQA